jgi:hypothetical protein
VETSRGSVRGTLLTDKIFYTKTTTGSVDVPKGVSGGLCEVITTTGSVELRVKKQ